LRVDLDPNDWEPSVRNRHEQWETNVAQADDGDCSLLAADPAFQQQEWRALQVKAHREFLSD
jgi:hypothetical protein